MDQSTLVEPKIDAAMELVRELDRSGLQPTCAAWYLFDDAGEWRLLLASPALDPLLKAQGAVAYRKVVDVLVTLSDASLSVSDIKLLATTDKLPTVLRALIRTPPRSVLKVDFQNNMLEGVFVKHAIIMRSAQ